METNNKELTEIMWLLSTIELDNPSSLFASVISLDKLMEQNRKDGCKHSPRLIVFALLTMCPYIKVRTINGKTFLYGVSFQKTKNIMPPSLRKRIRVSDNINPETKFVRKLLAYRMKDVNFQNLM